MHGLCLGVNACTGSDLLPNYICGGCSSGSDDCGYYWGDNDNDGIGGSNQGYHCSDDARVQSGEVVCTDGDFNDNCKEECKQNCYGNKNCHLCGNLLKKQELALEF